MTAPEPGEIKEPTPCCMKHGLPSVTLFGMTISNITLEEALGDMSRQIVSREPGYIVTPNVDHVIEFQNNSEFREAYKNAFLVLPDGVPILWAGKLLKKPLKQKISGSDLVYWLSEHAAQHGYRVYFMGGAEGVAEEAAQILQTMYPGLQIAGFCCPPIGFDKDPVKNQEVIDGIRDARTDICFVALGAPKQDVWSYKYCQATGAPIHIGVGGSFDFVAGRTRRAPEWMQRSGLEWFWRLMQEPRRLAHRYLIRDIGFFALLWREWWGTRN